MKVKKSIVSKCEACNKENATHEHHKDMNHKNNAKDNLQYLCALCHATVHGIDPKLSLLRYFVELRENTIKRKNQIENSIRGYSHIEIVIPQEETDYLEAIYSLIKKREKDIKTELKTYPNQQLIGWMLSIKGIGEMTVAKLICRLNPSDFATVSKMWRYCGLDATHIKRTKKISKEEAKMFGNPYLKKEILGVLADSFIKQRTDKYREIYDGEKIRQKELHSELTKMHIHRRAIRRMMKQFIKDYYVTGRKSLNLSLTKPFRVKE